MNTLATLLLWCVLQVTIVALATIVVYLLARRRGAQLRGTVVLTGLITATLLVPLVWLPWPRWELPRVGEAAVERPSATPNSDRMHRVNRIDGQRDSDRVKKSEDELASAPPPSVEIEPVTWRTTWNNFVDALQNPRSSASSVSQTTDPPLWPRLVLGLFAIALATGLARLAGGYWSVRRMIRGARVVQDKRLLEMVDVIRAELSCSSPITVRETYKTATAATTGWRNPVVLLPMNWRDWSEDQLRSVLAHELAHVSRRDYPLGCLAQCALALHYYHPLWQWLVGRLRLEQELAADALAAAIAGGREKYLRNLAELALARSETPIAWPARAFLPTRHTFLRRIEMLRNPKFAGDRSGRLLRVLSVVGLLICGIVVAGIRPGAVVADDAQTEPAAVDKASNNKETSQFANTEGDSAKQVVAYIPDDALGVIVLYPRKILTDPRFEEHAAQIKQFYKEVRFPAADVLRKAGVVPKNMEAAAFGFVFTTEGQGDRGDILVTAAIRFAEPIDRSIIEDAAAQTTSATEPTVYQLGKYMAAAIPDKRTLLLTYNAQAAASMMKAAQDNQSNPWNRLLKKLDSPAVAFLGNSEAISALVDRARKLKFGPAQQLDNVLAPVLPLLTDTSFAGIGLQLGDSFRVVGHAQATSAAGAERVAETLEALVTLAENWVRQYQRSLDNRPEQGMAQMEILVAATTQALASAEVEVAGKDVTLRAEFGEASHVLGDLLVSIQKARQAAYRVQAKNNLKQIGLAFHNYYATYGHFPPAVIEENGVKRSWRVELLPFLERGNLYQRYRQDEPWDSENNKKILAQMPPVFRNPTDNSPGNYTSYFVLTNKHAVMNARPAQAIPGIETAHKGDSDWKKLPKASFITLFTDEPINVSVGGRGPRFQDIFDGVSNTILAVEADRNVPWTKPEDIPVDPEKIKELQEDLGGFLALLCDGSVHSLPESMDPAKLKKLITPSGWEVIEELP